MSTVEDIKTCPACRESSVKIDFYEGWRITCGVCSYGTKKYPTFDEAAAKWLDFPKPGPCPSCGGDKCTVSMDYRGIGNASRVRCDDDNCNLLGPICDTPERAVRKWDELRERKP